MSKSIKYEIENNLTEHHSFNRFLEDRLNRIKSEEELVDFLCRYTAFNRVFAGCVLVLGGTFHIRGEIFGDSLSSDIAANILAAAEEEYFEGEVGDRITHRTLSYAFFENTVKYFNKDSTHYLAELSPATTRNVKVAEKIITGYCPGLNTNDNSLFQSLGFHIGSELSGSIEFTAIDKFLRLKYPTLVDTLEQTKTGGGKNAYYWIHSHTLVEEDHFAHALFAADKSIDCYCGNLTKEAVFQNLIDGYKIFFQVVESFIASTIPN